MQHLTRLTSGFLGTPGTHGVLSSIVDGPCWTKMDLFIKMGQNEPFWSEMASHMLESQNAWFWINVIWANMGFLSFWTI